MKTDPSGLLAAEPRHNGGAASQARAGRWLADLERAMLDARAHHGAAHGQHAHADNTPANAPTLPAQAADVANRLSPMAQASTAAAQAAAKPAQAAGQPMTATLREASPTAWARGVTVETTLPARPVATPARSTDSTTQAPTAARLAKPPRYARRHMQASGQDEVQLTLRDATLTAAQTPAVVAAVLARLREAGMAVHRLYINGQMFQTQTAAPEASSQDAPAASPSHLPKE